MEIMNAGNLITKLGLAALSASASFGITKTLEAKAESSLGYEDKADKAKKMASYAVGALALAILIWFIGNRIAKRAGTEGNAPLSLPPGKPQTPAVASQPKQQAAVMGKRG